MVSTAPTLLIKGQAKSLNSRIRKLDLLGARTVSSALSAKREIVLSCDFDENKYFPPIGALRTGTSGLPAEKFAAATKLHQYGLSG
jgi:hypothetical protein